MDQVGSNWFKLVQIGSKKIRLIIWFKSDKIGPNGSKLDQLGSNWSKSVQIGSHWIKSD